MKDEGQELAGQATPSTLGTWSFGGELWSYCAWPPSDLGSPGSLSAGLKATTHWPEPYHGLGKTDKANPACGARGL